MRKGKCTPIFLSMYSIRVKPVSVPTECKVHFVEQRLLLLRSGEYYHFRHQAVPRSHAMLAIEQQDQIQRLVRIAS